MSFRDFFYLKEAAPVAITFGQLKQAILDAANKKMTSRLATNAASLVPGVGNVMTAVSAAGAVAKRFLDPKGPAMKVFRRFMSIADTVRGAGILSKIDVDDNVSRIVADDVEDSFARHMIGLLNQYPDNTPIPPAWNMTNEMIKYLAQAYKGRTVAVPQQIKTASQPTTVPQPAPVVK